MQVLKRVPEGTAELKAQLRDFVTRNGLYQFGVRAFTV